MTLEERMLNGKLYDCADEKLQAQQRALNELVFDYNNTRPSDGQRRQELLRQIFQDMGEGCYIEPLLHANWGSHTHLGNHVYANFNLTLVDDTHVYIADNVMFGPNVTITAAATLWTRTCGARYTSTTSPCALRKTSGWARASSSCRG